MRWIDNASHLPPASLVERQQQQESRGARLSGAQTDGPAHFVGGFSLVRNLLVLVMFLPCYDTLRSPEVYPPYSVDAGT